MGHGGSSILPAMRCCQEEPPVLGLEAEARVGPIDARALLGPRARPSRAHCLCQEEAMPEPLESLTYTPVRFDAEGPSGIERSKARYPALARGGRTWTQRRAKAWEAWLLAAAAGRAITLLGPDAAGPPASRIPATLFIDRGLSMLSILHTSGAPASPVTILIDSIQVICPVTDFMMLADRPAAQLEESERSCAVLLQYSTEALEHQRLCLLEESEAARERFLQVLTALWLEQRDNHSMWF